MPFLFPSPNNDFWLAKIRREAENCIIEYAKAKTKKHGQKEFENR